MSENYAFKIAYACVSLYIVTVLIYWDEVPAILHWSAYILIGLVITVLSSPFVLYGFRLWHSYSLDKQRELNDQKIERRMRENGHIKPKKNAVNNKFRKR